MVVYLSCLNVYVSVAQLDRVFGYEPKGRGFESLQTHHFIFDYFIINYENYLFFHMGYVIISLYSGKWLNLVEHLVWDQGVAGSNPVFPTI